MNLNNNMIEQAKQYFIINRCSFSGATSSGDFSKDASIKRYTLSSINKIELLDFTNNNTIIFLGPPYYLEKKSKLYGNNGDMHENFNH